MAPSGFILTNEHVIHGAQRVSVLLPALPGARPTTPDSMRRRTFEAKVIGSQAEVDLALLKIEATDLPFLALGKAGPAADSGLKAGDVIRSINQTQIDSLKTLRKVVRAFKPGDAVALQVERDGKLSYLSFEME